MSKVNLTRPEFADWITRQKAPTWPSMPLTHVTKGIVANDIIREGRVLTSRSHDLSADISYYFYGRPAYRLGPDGIVRRSAACPFCFVFNPEVARHATSIMPFDSGAFQSRMYRDFIDPYMNLEDFALTFDPSIPNRIISAAFGSLENYFDGYIDAYRNDGSAPQEWEFHAQSYLNLISSRGRNEPDDRISVIELTIDREIPLEGNLKAIIVPHTIWTDNSKAPWLKSLNDSGVDIASYIFNPGRSPDYYQALLESALRELYIDWGILNRA